MNGFCTAVRSRPLLTVEGQVGRVLTVEGWQNSLMARTIAVVVECARNGRFLDSPNHLSSAKKPPMRQLSFQFAEEPRSVSAKQTSSPSGYKGLYRFHKYWGKKPHEPLAYVIEQLTEPGQIILDPFTGSGTTGREAILLARRFIGFDINPVAIEISRLLIHPPAPRALKAALQLVEESAKAKILKSYLLEDGQTAGTHYLWDADALSSVWVVGRGAARRRREFMPTPHDGRLSRSFSNYKSKFIRQPKFFTNSRINADPKMSLDDLLTGRAQRNLDLLIDAIDTCPTDVVRAVRLCLTAASGQMTKMVFAVTGRGKTTGRTSEKIEVGSWVIGFWRPRLHFEVNVWNCFEIRASALLKAVKASDPLTGSRIGDCVTDVVTGKADALLSCGDCRSQLCNIPDEAIHLVVTDPPHSDRIPYLELSEFWNSILGASADFDSEIVVSNAKERNKTPRSYSDSLRDFLDQVRRVLHPNGTLVVLFNARQDHHWEAIRSVCTTTTQQNQTRLRYLGFFPCVYSSGSVVQDNRAGSLKTDCALAFSRSDAQTCDGSRLAALARIPNWSCAFPRGLSNGAAS